MMTTMTRNKNRLKRKKKMNSRRKKRTTMRRRKRKNLAPTQTNQRKLKIKRLRRRKQRKTKKKVRKWCKRSVFRRNGKRKPICLHCVWINKKAFSKGFQPNSKVLPRLSRKQSKVSLMMLQRFQANQKSIERQKKQLKLKSRSKKR